MLLQTLHLQNLKVNTLIGIREHEKKSAQPLIIELKVTYDAQKAAHLDSIEYALDYSSLAKEIKNWVESSSYGLLEALHIKLTEWIIDRTQCKKLWLKIHKPLATGDLCNISIESPTST